MPWQCGLRGLSPQCGDPDIENAAAEASAWCIPAWVDRLYLLWMVEFFLEGSLFCFVVGVRLAVPAGGMAFVRRDSLSLPNGNNPPWGLAAAAAPVNDSLLSVSESMVFAGWLAGPGRVDTPPAGRTTGSSPVVLRGSGRWRF